MKKKTILHTRVQQTISKLLDLRASNVIRYINTYTHVYTLMQQTVQNMVHELL